MVRAGNREDLALQASRMQRSLGRSTTPISISQVLCQLEGIIRLEVKAERSALQILLTILLDMKGYVYMYIWVYTFVGCVCMDEKMNFFPLYPHLFLISFPWVDLEKWRDTWLLKPGWPFTPHNQTLLFDPP